MIPNTQPKSPHTMQVLNVQALLPLSYTLHPPRPSVVTEWVLSVFGWAHWKRMCHSSASSFISTPGQSLGQHTPVLSHKTCWMYVHAAEFQRSLWGFVLNEEKAGHTAWCKLAKEKESALQLQLLQHHAGSWSPWCWRLSSSSYCPPDSVHNWRNAWKVNHLRIK